MNAKDAYIEFYAESPWLTLAKKIVRAEVQRLMEHRTIIHTTPSGGFMAKFATDSKYLKHQELDGQDWVVTIDRVAQEILENNGEKQKKWVVYFKELEKGLALNSTNGKTLCKILGTDEMNDWTGQKITLYVKDDVEFQGELVSAIRVRPKRPA